VKPDGHKTKKHKDDTPRSTITEIVLPLRLRMERVRGPRATEESGACMGTKRELTYKNVTTRITVKINVNYFDNNVSILDERGALPGLADTPKLAGRTSLNDTGHLSHHTVNTCSDDALRLGDGLTCRPSAVSTAPMPRGSRLLGQVAAWSAPLDACCSESCERPTQRTLKAILIHT
jgi:hypothetical protein